MLDVVLSGGWPWSLSETKDGAQILTGLFTIGAIAFAFWKGRLELAANREQRERELERRQEELRWRMVEAAKKLNDEMLTDRGADCAMQMLDWARREFKLDSGELVVIGKEERLEALRTERLNFDDKEQFVRDCFDSFFYYIAIFEHYIRNQLVTLQDVQFPIDYYVPLIAQDRSTFLRFIKSYRQDKALAFLNRFPEWSNAVPPSNESHASVDTRAGSV